ncbi:hypothetical protein GGR52DRAFT_340074 [Hypoxylon sp. FL1284]|nr:hypothetical protein GGR52DRAFT_340074 [Hypoxylon sp. FL1284]
MQDLNKNDSFDSNKYRFPRYSQPGLEVVTAPDEQGVSGSPSVSSDNQSRTIVAPSGRFSTAPQPVADELYSPGLQVVQVERPSEGLQVVHTEGQWNGTNTSPWGHTAQSPSAYSAYSADSFTHSSGLIASNSESYYLNDRGATSASSLWPKEDKTPAKKGIRVKPWVLWTVGGVILLLILIGAVLGGILGARATQAHNGGGGSNSTSNGTRPDNPGSDSDPDPVPIRAGSRLAVTGYRTKTDYSIRLFYQDEDDQIRFTDKENAKANWTRPTVLDSLPFDPMKGGAIAAGAYVDNDPVPKLEFFYEDKDGLVRGQDFNFYFEDGPIPPKGEAGSINSYPLQMTGNTSISCYFPYIITQDEDNQVRWTTMKGQNPSGPQWVNDTNWAVRTSAGAGMVALPIAQKYVNAGGIVYRSAEGMLSIKIRDQLEPSNDGVAWRKGALSKAIPAGTSIGAFSVGRPYDNDNQVNTYVLYQQDDTIQVVWQDDDTGWKGPQTYDALKGAAKGTDIVCLTPGADDKADVELSREQDMNRCFFLNSDNAVKEVWYDGTNWSDVGTVPTS